MPPGRCSAYGRARWPRRRACDPCGGQATTPAISRLVFPARVLHRHVNPLGWWCLDPAWRAGVCSPRVSRGGVGHQRFRTTRFGIMTQYVRALTVCSENPAPTYTIGTVCFGTVSSASGRGLPDPDPMSGAAAPVSWSGTAEQHALVGSELQARGGRLPVDPEEVRGWLEVDRPATVGVEVDRGPSVAERP